MIIGNFIKTGNSFAGTIETLLFTVQAILEPLSNKPTSKSPDFKLVSGIREIGAAWKKTSQETGKEYLSVIIEDPNHLHQLRSFSNRIRWLRTHLEPRAQLTPGGRQQCRP
jgi:uncharacterized protein (DUF736 family)